MHGGPGNDVLRARDAVRDVVDGGPGIDSGSYDPRDRVTSVEKLLKTKKR
jgi:hypothetical protein